MTQPSNLKVKRLLELDELPPGTVEEAWMYAVRPGNPNKDHKVFLPDLIEESVEFISDEILQEAVEYTDQEVDQVRQDLLNPADSLGTDMVTYKLDDTNSVARGLRDRLGDAINAKDFGAVGDGITPGQQVFINSALQYLKERGGGTLHVPPGVYLLTAGIFVPSNCTLKGSGIDVTIFRAVDPFPVNHNLITNEKNDQLPRTDFDYNIHICDLTVDGNFMNRNTAGAVNGNGCGVRFSTVHDSSIRRVKAHYNVGHNFDIAASVNPNTTDNPPGGPNAPGPSLRIIVEDCQAHTANRDDNFTVHGSGYVTFSRCYAWHEHDVYPNIDTPQHGIEFDDGSYECIARDCYVEGVNDGFQVKGHDGIIAARSILIERCYAKNCARGFNITRDDPFDGLDVIIRDCVVDGVAPHAVTDVHPVRIYGYTNVLVDNLLVLNVDNSPNAVRIGPSSNKITIKNLLTRNSPFDDSLAEGVAKGVIYCQASGPPQDILVENIYCEGNITIPVVRFSSNSTRGIIRNVVASTTDNTIPALSIGTFVNAVDVSQITATGFAGPLGGTGDGGWALPDNVVFEWRPGGQLRASGSFDPEGVLYANSGSTYHRAGVGVYVKVSSGYGTTGWMLSGYSAPYINVSASRELAHSDIGRLLRKTGNTAITLTIPDSAEFPEGSQILVANNGGSSNDITITAGGSLTLYRNGVSGDVTVTPGTVVRLTKFNSISWMVF